MEQIVYGIDIDQTLSRGYVGSELQESIAYYEQRIGGTLPAPISDYPSLFQLPEVLVHHEQLPGACTGVRYLATLGTVGYYTVRKHEQPERYIAMQEATRAWLQEHTFPNAARVFFCRSVLDKMLTLVQQSQEGPTRLVLIDDRWQKALEGLQMLRDAGSPYADVLQTLRERFTLVAFGAHARPVQTSGVSVVALPSWSQIQQVIARNDQGELLLPPGS